jgi:ribosomal protein S18 acetylase RimI-like enzyme
LAAAALMESSVKQYAAIPGGRVVQSENATLLWITSAAASSFNRVTATTHTPDPAEIDRLAAIVNDAGVPWSLWLRDEPGPEVLRVAADHRRTDRGTVPLMVVSRADARLRGPRGGAPVIRVITSAERQLHLDLFAVSFGGSADVYGVRMAEPLIDAPWASMYVAELDGVPVATGYGVRVGDYVGVYCIGVPPEFRGRGYGRLVTERVMTDAFSAGATGAFLQSSDDGFPLYKSMGYETVETWTYLA